MAQMRRNIGETIVGNTIGGEAWQPASDQGQPSMPTWAKALQDAPGSMASTGSTAFRGSNTIIRGGWSHGAAHHGGAPMGGGKDNFGGSIRNNNPFRSRTWNRYGSQEMFHGEDGKYTPFQFLDKWGNKAAKKFGPESMKKGGMLEDGSEALSKGTYSRISAGLRIGNMGSGSYSGAAEHVGSFLQGAGFNASEIATLEKGGNKAVGQAVMMSGKGTVSNFLGGFMSGSSSGGMQLEAQRVLYKRAAVEGAEGAGARAAVRGGETAMRWGAEAAVRAGGKEAGIDLAGKLTTKAAGKMILRAGSAEAGAKAASYVGARAVGALIPGVNVAMAVWTAYDVAKMTTTLMGGAIKGSVKLASDAAKSIKGGMNNDIMGQGFKDNAASMTSRQRGVQAIQNSRLNARSILGSEAGPMSAHFG